jgi:hypothetical protein
MDVYSTLPFELDIPVYEIVMFTLNSEDNTFEVLLNIIDPKKLEQGITKYKTKRMYLPDHPKDPSDSYHQPSALLYMGPNGIGRATASMRKFQGMPEGARSCYQCEYDEYVWKRVEEGTLPKSDAYFYNWAVWDTYIEYRRGEEAGEQILSHIEKKWKRPEKSQL